MLKRFALIAFVAFFCLQSKATTSTIPAYQTRDSIADIIRNYFLPVTTNRYISDAAVEVKGLDIIFDIDFKIPFDDAPEVFMTDVRYHLYEILPVHLREAAYKYGLKLNLHVAGTNNGWTMAIKDCRWLTDLEVSQLFLPDPLTVPLKTDPKISLVDLYTHPDGDRRYVLMDLEEWDLENYRDTQFVGGERALEKWLTDNVTYPEEYKGFGITGYVDITIFIDETGEAQVRRIKNGMGYAFDMEAIRAILKMPKWKPAMCNGHPTGETLTLSILFKQ